MYGVRVLITGFPAGSWATNCYVVAAGPAEPCVIVDPGQDSIDGVLELVREHSLAPAAVLLTHGHIDHIWSVAPISDRFGIPAAIHVDDRYRLADPAGTSFSASRDQLRAMTKNELELTEPSDVQVLNDGDELELVGLVWRVRHAPGHTEGSVVFDLRAADGEFDQMFSGDVLFAGSIGRTDLPGGDPTAMKRTLERVIGSTPDHVSVLPGHGPATTIGQERTSNPYLAGVDLAPPGNGL
jgi:glyoxylase-like metal-dependent hydrolase (beta-lactamase superfamily II)